MFTKPRHGLFVTGTDTAIGKTYVAAMIARSLRRAGASVGVYKPAASGCRCVEGELVSDDAVALWEAAGQQGDLAVVCPQSFEAPLAPHLAARAEGKELDADLLRVGLQHWDGRCDVVIVEGAGVLLSPMGDKEYVADLACDFGYPLVVVAPNVLGVINQTLQTLLTAATYRQGLGVVGVILNDVVPTRDDPSQLNNFDELVCRCTPSVLTRVSWGSDQESPVIDWLALATADRPSVRQVTRLPIFGHRQHGSVSGGM